MNAANSVGFTPLYLAAHNRHLEVARPPLNGHGPLGAKYAFNIMDGRPRPKCGVILITHAIISLGRPPRLMATAHLARSMRSI